jgi:hypothetical protein
MPPDRPHDQPGQHGDSPRFIPLLGAIRFARRGGGPPAHPPRRCDGGQGLFLAGEPRPPALARDHHGHPGQGGPGGQPPQEGITRRPTPFFNAERYKERNTAGRCFSKPRQHRAVATRYDKRDRIYRGTIDVASIRIWLRVPGT